VQGDSDETRDRALGMSWWIKFTIFVLGMVIGMLMFIAIFFMAIPPKI
jgi:hypothetical protein